MTLLRRSSDTDVPAARAVIQLFQAVATCARNLKQRRAEKKRTKVIGVFSERWIAGQTKQDKSS